MPKEVYEKEKMCVHAAGEAGSSAVWEYCSLCWVSQTLFTPRGQARRPLKGQKGDGVFLLLICNTYCPCVPADTVLANMQIMTLGPHCAQHCRRLHDCFWWCRPFLPLLSLSDDCWSIKLSFFRHEGGHYCLMFIFPFLLPYSHSVTHSLTLSLSLSLSLSL